MRNPLKIWTNLSKPVKASVVFLAATVFLKGLVFVTTPIFTRIMSESDMGVVGTYQSWKGIFEAIVIFSLTSAGVFNVGMSKYKHERDRYISNIIALCSFTSIIGGCVILICYDYIGEFLNIPKSLVLLMMLYAAIMPAHSFWISKARYEYKYKAVFIVTVLMATLGQAFAIVAVVASDNSLSEVRLWATALIELPIGLFFMTFFIRKGKQIFDKSIWKDTLTFAIPLIPHYLSSIVLTASDRIMIGNLDSIEAAGIYTVVYGVGSVVTIVWGAIQGSLTPYIYENLDEGKIDGISSLSEKLIIGFGMICVLVSLFAPELIKILGPQSYYIGVYVVPPVVSAIAVSCLYNLFSAIEFYHKKSFFIAFASVVAAVVNLVLNYFFIPILGFVAAGYTTLIAYIILSIMHYVNMRRIDNRPIYNSKRIFSIMAIIVLLCILSICVYELTVIRYILVVILLFAMILKRNLIIGFLRK